MEHTRKFWMTIAGLVTLTLGLVLVLAFEELSDVKFTAWGTAVGAVVLGGFTANVVTKKIVGKKK